MPIYVYRCPRCECEIEEIRSLAEFDAPAPTCRGVRDEQRGIPEAVAAYAHPDTVMERAPTTASIAFMTKGGNVASFSPSHGPVARGNRRPKTIGRGHGLGGRRPPPSPKNDPEFRAQLVRSFAEKGIKS